MSIEIREFDVVIVGAGGSGLRAALQMAQSNLNVAVISKVYPTRSHTVSAQGGIAAPLGNVMEDNWQYHMYDTIMGSDCLSDQEAVEYMCMNASQSIVELEHMGMPFSRLENGKIYQRAFGGHTVNFGEKLGRRTCAAADRTGHAMLHTLFQANIKAKTNFFNEWFAIDLVRGASGGISGVVAMCIETGEKVFFKARAVALATGGAGRIFKSTTNAFNNTGDGMGLITRAGLPLQDMEFWQFHPTGIYGAGCLMTEGCRGEGGYLVNKDGERFMERYSPHLKDLDCRDFVSQSSIREILDGRGCGEQADHVMLKLDHLGEDLLNERLPGILELSRKFANVDPVKDPVPVLPTCHYQMGGIPTNFHGQVLTVDEAGNDRIVDGLYAAGECACVSVHGANRLGTNSLLDLVVFGRAVGIKLEDELKKGLDYRSEDSADLDRISARLERWNNPENKEDPYKIRTKMKELMQNSFAVFRDKEPMEKALVELEQLQEQLKTARLGDHSETYNTTRIEMLELDNLMETALVTARSALHRTESRGAHYRYDCPDRDDEQWVKHTVAHADGSFAYREVNMKPKHIDPIPVKAREH
jgi:succinate dehydrogenase / fumarate reductase, flavoprotein subunit